MTFLLDTNILIGIVTGRKPYADMLREIVADRNLLATCETVVSEIYTGMRPSEAELTEALLRSLEFLPSTYAAGKLAGEMLAEAREARRSVTLADCSIAATAITHNCTLITENARDFHLPKLKLRVPD
jgi:predicted nucleic acid-binding protein